MKIDILTLFPEMFTPLQGSILGRAQKEGKIQINVVNLRDYTEDKHLKCDDYPFGGGAGMVMTAQPIYDAIKAIDPNHESIRIYMSPKGKTLDMAMVKELAGIDEELFGDAASDYTRAAALDARKTEAEERLLEIYEEIGV